MGACVLSLFLFSLGGFFSSGFVVAEMMWWALLMWTLRGARKVGGGFVRHDVWFLHHLSFRPFSLFLFWGCGLFQRISVKGKRHR